MGRKLRWGSSAGWAIQIARIMPKNSVSFPVQFRFAREIQEPAKIETSAPVQFLKSLNRAARHLPNYQI